LFAAALSKQRSGEFAAAESLYRQIISLDPHLAPVHFNLGIVLRILNRHEEAIAAYRQSLSLDPNFPQAWNNLGNTLRALGRLDESIAAFQKALTCKPDYVDALNNLGTALKDVGQLDQALACLDRAIDLQPNNPTLANNRLYALHYHPDWPAAKILAEAKSWNDRYASHLRPTNIAHQNDRSPARRLRIAYLSANFREHCQALFMLPLLSHHDHAQFEIVCYSDVVVPDAITNRLRALADQWRDTARLSDDQLADLIRRDQIDVLVDLTLHMSNNRLLVFARKPAPIQATWLGYPGTTGLDAMDYRLTDPFLDPPTEHDNNYVERSFRLPHTFWCYDPLSQQPASNASPVFENHQITFGCLNNFCKLNDPVLKMWSPILHAIPTSKLLLLSPTGHHRQNILNHLAIDPSRVEFIEFQPREKYLQTYNRIDICLDTFPYNGHTTTLDALWMAVPVISLCGETAVSRAGLSLMRNLGLSELVARDAAMFSRIAVELAGDLSRLAMIRSSLREKMHSSPMMDAQAFARDIESAYHEMWQRWLISIQRA
jgi:predicted O-linked N-acetylglucosamine transferase (SPINDLY family)